MKGEILETLTSTVNPQENVESAKKITQIVYFLQALAILVGVAHIAGVIINYLKQEEVKGTLFESHFRWQVRTFWFSILWSVIGFVTVWLMIDFGKVLFVLGFVIMIATGIWYVYRVVKGWLCLNAGKPMYQSY